MMMMMMIMMGSRRDEVLNEEVCFLSGLHHRASLELAFPEHLVGGAKGLTEMGMQR